MHPTLGCFVSLVYKLRNLGFPVVSDLPRHNMKRSLIQQKEEFCLFAVPCGVSLTEVMERKECLDLDATFSQKGVGREVPLKES